MTDSPIVKRLAENVLTMALDGGMPDTYWLTDRRIALACDLLGIEPTFAQQHAEKIREDWEP